MTYIILRATELLAVRDPNVHARYHATIHHRDAGGNLLQPHEVSPYLKRLCEVNINTRATPAIHGDVSVTESLARYYESHQGVDSKEALADAHDYCSIGCIEENSAARRYGYTGALNIALSTVLEMAMFGRLKTSFVSAPATAKGLGKKIKWLFTTLKLFQISFRTPTINTAPTAAGVFWWDTGA